MQTDISFNISKPERKCSIDIYPIYSDPPYKPDTIDIDLHSGNADITITVTPEQLTVIHDLICRRLDNLKGATILDAELTEDGIAEWNENQNESKAAGGNR